MGAGGSFPSTVEAPLELLRVGPLAAGPSPLPQALCGRAGAVPAGLLAPASLSPPQSLPLLCCILFLPVHRGHPLTINRCPPAVSASFAS